MGVPLAPVAGNANYLTLEQTQVGIAFVVYLCHKSPPFIFLEPYPLHDRNLYPYYGRYTHCMKGNDLLEGLRPFNTPDYCFRTEALPFFNYPVVFSSCNGEGTLLWVTASLNIWGKDRFQGIFISTSSSFKPCG
jgi:hypothetical protein